MFSVLINARKGFGRIAVLLSVMWLAACQPINLGGGLGGGPSINPGDPVPVALLVPRGGNHAQDALLASNLENAARLAAADLGGVKIDLRVYGTAANPAQAQVAAKNAIADGAKIIVGPLYGEAANAVAVAVADTNVNVLSFSNNTTIAGGNLFILGPTFDNTANRLAGFARRQGKARVLAVHAQDAGGQLGAAAIEQAVARTGGTMVGKIGYPFSQQGIIGAIPQIKAAVSTTGADAIFMTGTTDADLPILTQLLPEAGIPSSVAQYVGLSRWDIPAQATSQPGLQGGWFAIPDPVVANQFSQRYSAAYGSAPHPIAGLAYDAVSAIGALVKQGKRNALSGAALTQSAGFRGANGVFRLLPNGTNERGLAVATLRDKKVVVIDPAPRSFGGAGF